MVVHFVQSAGLLEGLSNGLNGRSGIVEVPGSLSCSSTVLRSNLLYSREVSIKNWGIFGLKLTTRFSRDLLYGISYLGKMYLIKGNLHCSLNYKV
jgi:hypothetical protein